ncbi:MAG: hypothetical protein JXJ04_11480, partial [Spirochaetales bacterium]|nr:hypothetical protein [Spirochaetales bacterium]
MKNIDFHQLYIITKYSFLQEIRYKRSLKGKKHSYRTFISMLFIYIFSGLMMGFLSAQINLYSAAFFSSALFMILIGNFILLEFPTLITGPEDFSAYSSLPITSSTYFYAKVLTVLIFVTIFSFCYSLPGAFLLFQKTGNFLVFPGFIYPQFAGGIFISLLIINFYGILLRFVPLQTIRKVSTTLNFLLFFIFYGGYFLIFQYLKSYAHLFKVNYQGFFIFFPNAWGSSLFILGDNPYAILSLFLSLFVPVILLLASKRIISIDFAERIAEQTLMSPKKKKRNKNSRSSVLWKTFEEKAMALLIRSNFTHDVQFKLSILTIIPLTILYFIIVLFVYKGSLENPFTQSGILGFHKTLFLYVAIGFFPFYIKSALAYSQDAEASWIFFTTAYNRLNLILATRKFVFIFFMLPYFLLFFIIYIIMAGVIIPVILHFLVVIILAYIQTNIFLFFMTDIPFSKKPQRGRMLLSLLARMSISVLLPVPLYVFVIFLYPQPLFYGIL